MKEDILYILLDVMIKNGSISRLTRKNISYSEIAEYVKEAIVSGLLQNDGKQILVTDEGVKIHQKLEENYKLRNKELWIEKDEKNMIPRLDKKTIFIPNQNELTFL